MVVQGRAWCVCCHGVCVLVGEEHEVQVGGGLCQVAEAAATEGLELQQREQQEGVFHCLIKQ
jgi:hypothetical protein